MMIRDVALWGLAIALLPCAEKAQAEDKEPLAVVSLGAAVEAGLPGPISRGPSAAVEFSAIKDWLEVEVGGARLSRRGLSEWEAEVIFRKPFNLSETTELMVGLGPIWTRSKAEGTKPGIVFALDLMFWPSPDRKFGWFVEPTYSVLKGNERSLGVSFGLLIGIH
jgi:hypothetical protein